MENMTRIKLVSLTTFLSFTTLASNFQQPVIAQTKGKTESKSQQVIESQKALVDKESELIYQKMDAFKLISVVLRKQDLVQVN